MKKHCVHSFRVVSAMLNRQHFERCDQKYLSTLEDKTAKYNCKIERESEADGGVKVFLIRQDGSLHHVGWICEKKQKQFIEELELHNPQMYFMLQGRGRQYKIPVPYIYLKWCD